MGGFDSPDSFTLLEDAGAADRSWRATLILTFALRSDADSRGIARTDGPDLGMSKTVTCLEGTTTRVCSGLASPRSRERS